MAARRTLAALALLLVGAVALLLFAPVERRPGSAPLLGERPVAANDSSGAADLARDGASDAALAAGDAGAARRASADPRGVARAPEPWPDQGFVLVVREAGTRTPAGGALVDYFDLSDGSARELLQLALGGVATTEILSRHSTTYRADRDGRVRLPYSLVGDRIVVSARAGKLAGSRYVMPEDWVEPLELLVAAEDGVVARVIDANGAPLEGIPVTHVVGDPKLPLVVERCLTGSNGLAAFVHSFDIPFEPGERHALRIDGLFQEQPEVVLERESWGGMIDLVCPPFGAVVAEFVGRGRVPNGITGVLSLAVPTPGKRILRTSLYSPRTHGTARTAHGRSLRFEPVGLGLDLVLEVGLLESDELGVELLGPTRAGEVVFARLEDWPLDQLVRGVLVDANAVPQAEQSVIVELQRGRELGFSDRVRADTDADGAFEFVLPPDEPQPLLVFHSRPTGLMSDAISLEDLQSQQRDDGDDAAARAQQDSALWLGEVVLERAEHRFEGRVLGFGGPLVGASVHAWVERAAPGGDTERDPLGAPDVAVLLQRIAQGAPDKHWSAVPSCPVRTDRDGRFELAWRGEARRLGLNLRHPGHTEQAFVVDLPVARATFQLEPAGTLRGWLSAPEPLAPSDFELQLVDAETNEVVRTMHTGSNGQVLIEGLALEPYHLVVAAHGVRVHEVHSIVPELANSGDHPWLDPLDLERYVVPARIAVEPPAAGLAIEVVIATTDEPRIQLWRSAGATSGPWDVRLALPSSFDRSVTVGATGCRAVELGRPAGDVFVQLERGPLLEFEVAVPSDYPVDAAFGLAVNELGASLVEVGGHVLEVDAQRRASVHLSRGGPVDIVVIVGNAQDGFRVLGGGAEAGEPWRARVEVPPGGLVHRFALPPFRLLEPTAPVAAPRENGDDSPENG